MDCIQEVVADKFRNLLRSKFDLREIDDITLASISDQLTTIEVLSHIGVKPASAIIKQFDPLVKAMSAINNARLMHSKDFEYVIWDWKLGYLQNSLTNYSPDQASTLIKSLESVLASPVAADYSSLLES